MRGIMAARTKPLQVLAPQAAANFANYASYELPVAKTGVRLIDASDAGKLIDILRNEAKVI
jgi:electron transfer flavoprotein beta subunit